MGDAAPRRSAILRAIDDAVVLGADAADLGAVLSVLYWRGFCRCIAAAAMTFTVLDRMGRAAVPVSTNPRLGGSERV